jgi:hypothetical protein
VRNCVGFTLAHLPGNKKLQLQEPITKSNAKNHKTHSTTLLHRPDFDNLCAQFKPPSNRTATMSRPEDILFVCPQLPSIED